MKHITVLIPCHNEEGNILPLYRALSETTRSLASYNWTFLFVNDGSTDDTLAQIKSLRRSDERVAYISLSRNFGKENAMMAGFDAFTGDAMIIMDADLQHPPHVIPEMLSWWEDGFDDVYAKRSDRGKESWLRRRLSLCYYRMLEKMCKTEVLANVGDFRLLDKKCVDALRRLRETQRYTKGLYSWIGFQKKEICIRQEERYAGASSFSYRKLVNLAIEGITSYSTAPLRISAVLGLAVSFIALLYMCYILIKTLLYGEPVQGFPTLIVVILFLGGIQLLSIGIIGEYLGRIFYETKERPIYIIQDKDGVS